MSPLSKEEILAQLKNLGIDSTSEADFYFREYKEYVDLPDLHNFAPQAYHDEALNNYPRRGRAVNRISRVYTSLAPRIVNTMRSIREKASRRIKH